MAPGSIIHKKTHPPQHCVSAPVDYKELREGEQPTATGEMQHAGEKRVGGELGYWPFSICCCALTSLCFSGQMKEVVAFLRLKHRFILSQINQFSVDARVSQANVSVWSIYIGMFIRFQGNEPPLQQKSNWNPASTSATKCVRPCVRPGSATVTVLLCLKSCAACGICRIIIK